MAGNALRPGHLNIRIGGWPTQAWFWREWGCSDFPNPVIPTGGDHREGDDLRSGGTLCLTLASDGWRLGRNQRHENTKERQEDSVQHQNCPTQAKTRLEWATRRDQRPGLAQPPQEVDHRAGLN